MADTIMQNEAYQAEDLTITSALQQIFKNCKNHNMLALGTTEVIKSLYRTTSTEDEEIMNLVVVAKDNLSEFTHIIEDKCRQLNIPLLFVETREELASITPLKRIKKASAIGIKDFVCESREKAFIVNAYKN